MLYRVIKFINIIRYEQSHITKIVDFTKIDLEKCIF